VAQDDGAMRFFKTCAFQEIRTKFYGDVIKDFGFSGGIVAIKEEKKCVKIMNY